MLAYKISALKLTENEVAQREAFGFLLHAYRMDGHVLGRELITLSVSRRLEAYVQIPAADAFESRVASEWISKALESMREAGLSAPEFTEIDGDETGTEACSCDERSSLILFTTYVQLSPPVTCGDCYRAIPLYWLPRFDNDEFREVMTWQSNYQACDTLFMNSGPGERSGYRQMSRVDSHLTRDGRAICKHFEDGTGRPAYYYLHRYYARSQAREAARPCPGCGGDWALSGRWHNYFDFKCDDCRLLSAAAP
jgi:predicted  nucleic acid-binding Zn ribbon protein